MLKNSFDFISNSDWRCLNAEYLQLGRVRLKIKFSRNEI